VCLVVAAAAFVYDLYKRDMRLQQMEQKFDLLQQSVSQLEVAEKKNNAIKC
jgi:uncharacterized protein (DUF3084 family)